jgi:hypothetical protein
MTIREQLRQEIADRELERQGGLAAEISYDPARTGDIAAQMLASGATAEDIEGVVATGLEWSGDMPQPDDPFRPGRELEAG